MRDTTNKLARALLLLILTRAAPVAAGDVDQAGFIAAAFAGTQALTAMQWLTPELQEVARKTLGHPYPALRVRYWHEGERSAWILDEIGKELPITVGVVVNEGGIEQLRILAFRESRGGEVRYPFFTDQFGGARLDGNLRLDRDIDGITGATMSVRAVTGVARFALHLDAARQQQAARAVALQE